MWKTTFQLPVFLESELTLFGIKHCIPVLLTQLRISQPSIRKGSGGEQLLKLLQQLIRRTCVRQRQHQREENSRLIA